MINLDDAADALWGAITDIITLGFNAFRDDIMGGIFDNFLVIILDTLGVKSAFLLIFTIFLFIFFLKFVWWPTRS